MFCVSWSWCALCYVLFSPRSSDLPSSLLTRHPRTPPHSTVLASSLPSPPSPPLAPSKPYSPHQHLPSLSPSLYFLQHSWTLNPLDLWIFPGSPLDLPVFPRTPISGSFLASLLLFLLFHLHLRTPASQSPHVTLSCFYLRSLVPPLTSFHIDSSLLCHRPLSYSLNSTMTHSPWLIASPTSYINP